MTAELDYAFLAEYAKVDKGRLTAVGASFTEVQASSSPSILELSVAGRVRWLDSDEPPTLRMALGKAGEQDGQLSLETMLEVDEHAVRYDGKVANVFAFRGPMYIGAPGIYECHIYLNDQHVRRLAFEAVSSDSDEG